jgi:hypothetical protein
VGIGDALPEFHGQWQNGIRGVQEVRLIVAFPGPVRGCEIRDGATAIQESADPKNGPERAGHHRLDHEQLILGTPGQCLNVPGQLDSADHARQMHFPIPRRAINEWLRSTTSQIVVFLRAFW